MHDDIERILWSDEALATRIAALGEALTAEYIDRRPLVVGILSGSFVFMADLVRAMKTTVEIDFMAVSSYGESTTSSGVVRTVKDLNHSIEGRDVLLVEDIVDTGLTLRYLQDNLKTRGPRSLRACVLLDKAQARAEEVVVDYVGFSCPDEFVVGYGLDYAGRYRNLPYIGVLRRSVYA